MPESSFLALDSQKARDLLGWKNKYTLDQSLEATQDWYREQKTGSNMNKITKEHVKFHESFGSDR
jgi:CDP-glucose 4,6-dehydratase